MSSEVDLSEINDDRLISEVRCRNLDSYFESTVEIEIEPDYSELKTIADMLKTGRTTEAIEELKEMIYDRLGVIL